MWIGERCSLEYTQPESAPLSLHFAPSSEQHLAATSCLTLCHCPVSLNNLSWNTCRFPPHALKHFSWSQRFRLCSDHWSFAKDFTSYFNKINSLNVSDFCFFNLYLLQMNIYSPSSYLWERSISLSIWDWCVHQLPHQHRWCATTHSLLLVLHFLLCLCMGCLASVCICSQTSTTWLWKLL